MERDRGTIGEILGCLTNSTTVNIVKCETADTRPIKLAFDKIPGLQTTGMTDGGSVMEGTNDRLADIKICRNIESTFIECETVLDGPVRGEKFLCG